MNVARARELFSAHREGTLEPTLRPLFDRALASDSEVQAEYLAFCAAMDDLDALRDEAIEIPRDLSHRIALRLEEQQVARPKPWTAILLGYGRRYAFAGMAAVALLGAGIGILARGGANTAGVASGPSVSTSPAPVLFEFDGHVLTVRSPDGKGKLAVQSGQTHRYAADRPVTLDNPNEVAAEFVVRLDRQTAWMVYVPGSVRTPGASGQGTLSDFARALSDRLGRPVRFERTPVDVRLAWNLQGNDALTRAEMALTPVGYSADVRDGGTIVLSR